MSTIPASAFVNIVPSVLAPGGSALDLIGLMLTSSTRVPIGTIQSFADPDSVSDYFGDSSSEASIAGTYFDGFDDSTVKPGSILFAQYPVSNVGAFLRGADISALTLAELQALSGTLAIVIDGLLKSGSVNLAAATSFSNAAQLLQNGLSIQGPTSAIVTGSIAADVLTVSAVTSGAIAVGDLVTGTGVSANTYVTGLGTGLGGVGTYNVNNSQTALSETITTKTAAVQYDSVSGGLLVLSPTTGNASTMAFGSGTLAPSLKLDAIDGAVLSQGTAAGAPAAFMNGIVGIKQNWITFTHIFDPDASGNTNKLAFSAWASGKNNRYAYVPWDDDPLAASQNPASSSLGRAVAAAQYSATSIWYAPDATLPAFIMGAIASISTTEVNGRTSIAYRSQAGLVATVTDLTSMTNLLANGYNFYGAVGAANENFVFAYNGSISGDFDWLDSFVNQVWLNNSFQISLLTLLTSAKSIPYNAAGRAQIQASLADPIQAALSFGAIRPGVTLSSAQKSAINTAAGGDAASTLQTQGWYLQVLDASPTVRAARGSPPCKFWYTDGESVQSFDLASVAVQ